MKKTLLFFLLFAFSFAAAQSVPTTPNIGLYIPLHGTTNWDLYMDSNSNMLDSYLSGGTVLPFIHMGKIQLDSYADFQAITTPANPASGVCRTYFDLGSGIWKGINSVGATCSPNSSPSGTPNALAFFNNIGVLSSEASIQSDGLGNLTGIKSATFAGTGTAKMDFPEGVSPGNPSAGSDRIYADSTSHLLTCLTSAGANCLVPFASPAFTGTPTVPTAAVDTNTTQAASTAFVLGQAAAATPLIDGSATVGTSTRYARADHVHPTDTSRAALVSPTFTGTPLAPTAAVDTNTTQLSTTAFVLGQASSSTPLIDGTATIGTSTRFARADHIHPTDTTRAPLASPTFTGTVTIPLEASTTNCASSGGTCAAAPAGRISIAAAATTVTVATTAVTANSEIMVTEDSTLGTALSVTCNTTTGRTYTITTRTAGTSFVITSSAAPAANPACLSYRIIN